MPPSDPGHLTTHKEITIKAVKKIKHGKCDRPDGVK